MSLIKSRHTKKIIIFLIFLPILPLFIKILDLHRFLIFKMNFLEVLFGTGSYFFKSYKLYFFLFSIPSTVFLGYFVYKVLRRKLYRDFWFLLGSFVTIAGILPLIILGLVKVALLSLYVFLFVFLFTFLVFHKRPYDFLKSFALSSLILFPIFAAFLMIGFNASAARPKKTILSGSPEYNLLDERCDRKRLLSQPQIKPIWIEDVWLYGGVATKDGRFIYFSDNGYGVIGFEVMGNGEFRKLPSVDYPPNFNAALYSHRLYLTPDEKYLFYFGARSSEFVFIDRELLRVTFVVPTVVGLDGVTAIYDTKRDLIYGFPFVGKRVPVLSYHPDRPELVKWIDFSGLGGIAIQGAYITEEDIIVISTSDVYVEYDAANFTPIFASYTGPMATFSQYSSEKDIYFSSNIFLTFFNLFERQYKFMKTIKAPFGIKDIFYNSYSDMFILVSAISPKLYILKDSNILKEIYSGPRARGVVIFKDFIGKKRVVVASSCGVFEISDFTL